MTAPAARNIPANIRAIIGMHNMGFRDPEEIARHVYEYAGADPHPHQVDEVHRVLWHPTPLQAEQLILGLPNGAGGYLFLPVRCPKCRYLVNTAPCVLCHGVEARPDLAEDDEDDEFDVIPADEATDAKPGTPEKIAVFRRRVDLGMGLSHPDDPYHQPAYEPVTIPVVNTANIFAAAFERESSGS